MSTFTLTRLHIGLFISIIFASILPILAQTRLNQPTAITISGAVAEQAAKPADQPLDIAAYEKLLASNPVDFISENNLGARYYAAGRYDEALALIQHAAAALHDMWTVQVNMSIALAHQKAFPAALKYAQAAYKLEPKNIRVRQQLCDMYLAVQDGASALPCFESLAKDSADPEDLLGYGEALVLTGDGSRAEDAIRRVIEAMPRLAQAYNGLGMAEFKQKNYKGAVASFREAISLKPDDSTYRFNMGVADMAMRNREGAISQYNLLKESDPKLAGKLYNMMFADKILVVDH
jgi:tetratricopeptide (TPR) repeat protein